MYGLKPGINFYDTAIAYQNGASGQFVGKVLRDYAKRNGFVIATKQEVLFNRGEYFAKTNQVFSSGSKT